MGVSSNQIVRWRVENEALRSYAVRLEHQVFLLDPDALTVDCKKHISTGPYFLEACQPGLRAPRGRPQGSGGFEGHEAGFVHYSIRPAEVRQGIEL